MARGSRRSAHDSEIAEIQAARNPMDVAWPTECSKYDCPDRQRQCEAVLVTILSLRVSADWPSFDLVIACNLARSLVAYDRLLIQIEEQGEVLFGGKSGDMPIQNPAMAALEKYRGANSQMARQLCLNLASVTDPPAVSRAGRANGSVITATPVKDVSFDVSDLLN